MSSLRLFGLIVAGLIVVYAILQYRHGRYRRIELLIGLAIGIALGAVSANPSVADGITAVFAAPSRIVAIAILSNLVLFAIILFALREISDLRSSLSDLVSALAQEEYAEEMAEAESEDIVVVIPAFNEEKNLEVVLPKIPPSVESSPVSTLVIVDGARDQSESVARSYSVPVTSHAINRGGGAAIRTGYELAIRNGAQIVVTMDADGQHNPAELERLVGPILHGQADVVLGNRFAGAYAERGSARHAGIVGFSWLVSLLSGVRIHDCTNGYRAIRASELAKLDLHEQQFHTAEFIMEAARHNLRIIEAPVSVTQRHEGTSKKPRGVRYPLAFAWALLKRWLLSYPTAAR
ncbi:MAG: glycosyltransferase family 2 protein [Anaerolineales bacterium]